MEQKDLKYMGLEADFNPNDILLGFKAILGITEDNKDIEMYSLGFIFITFTWIWQEK